jgi:hypothetical protein
MRFIMSKAKTRVSTPRRTASKIKPKPVASDEDRAEAFLDLELPMHELYCMAEIAEAVIDMPAVSTFAASLLCEKVRELRAQYRAGLYAEKAVQS